MIDPTDNRVFKASAFEPKDTDVSKAVQNARLVRKGKQKQSGNTSKRMILDDDYDNNNENEIDLPDDSGPEEITHDTPSPAMASDDSSDDELPDPSRLLAHRKKGSPQKAGPSNVNSKNISSRDEDDNSEPDVSRMLFLASFYET
jgi:hypothetical protein